MKKRNMVVMSMMLLVVLLIGGGTFAFFTASADPIVNNFKAGTLKIKVIENFCPPTNVNPGDCYNKDVWVENCGSKRAVVRIAVEDAFKMVNGEVWANDLGVAKYTLGNGWFKKTIDGKDYFVYNRVLGTASHHDPLYNKTSNLFTSCGVCFDGPKMGNDYQGATFTLKVTPEAIQATNGAPADWGLKVKWDKWHYGNVGTKGLNGEESPDGPAVDELGTVEEL